MKKIAIPVCAIAAATAFCAYAQEMGEEAQPAQSEEAAPAEAAAEPAAAEEVQPQMPADEGQQIVVEVQQQKDVAVADTATKDVPSAAAIVQNLLNGRDASGKNRIPGKPVYQQGFDKKRRSIIQIGTAMAPVSNPATSNDYIAVRQMLANEAALDAKVKIIRELRQQVSASESISVSNSREADQFKKKHAEEYARLEAQRAKVQQLLEELDAAEAARLKGRTVLDDWNSVVDAIVKKLDSAYDPAKGQTEKAARCAMLKDAIAEAKKTLNALEEAAKKTPIGKNASEFATYFDMDLFGVTTLYQAESYNSDGTYEIAVASVWSPKLQDRAIRMLHGLPLEPGKPGKLPLLEWLAENEDSLAAMVGSRQYIDDEGESHIIGIAACEIPKNANRRQIAYKENDMSAEQAVLFALYESTKGSKSKREEMYKYDSEDNENAKENDTCSSYAEAIQGIVAKRPVSGLSVIYRTEKIHPISQKKIHISVVSINGSLSEMAEDLLDETTVAKMEDIAHIDIKRGRQDVRDAAVEAVRQSPAAYNAGVEMGTQALADKLGKRTGEAGAKIGVIAIETKTEKKEEEPKRPRTGVFVGDVDPVDDF